MAEIVCHFITVSVDPARGGLQELGRRLAETLSATGIADVVVHAVNQAPEDAPANGIDLRPLLPNREAVAAPLGVTREDLLHFGEMGSQGYQVNELVLRASLGAELDRRPNARHLIVSFSLVRLGYTAQRLATALRRPHIAMVTGSDFNRDLADPTLAAAALHVVSHADWLVVCNEEQRAILQNGYGRQDRMSVFHGIVPPACSTQKWSPRKSNEPVVVSDIGYSFKKATHLLVEACRNVRDHGHPLNLSIVGRFDADQREFWTAFASRAACGTSPWVELAGYVAKPDIEPHLLSGSVYCSSSLGEGSSNSALQALALGMPMVCTRTGSLPDFAPLAGAWMILVPPGDAGALADGLRNMFARIEDGTITGPNPNANAIARQVSSQGAVDHWTETLHSVDRNSRALS